ncbi:zinc finger CCCH domain-containing protein 17-like isoform X2 [Primulina huaijiensis]|uniref:zinc finger CCCH domain-containing protein 17-like isoform X2 n=1 Tax=Primulina huaijiensis TaxID=1492673 RepID=UPI003CC76EEA
MAGPSLAEEEAVKRNTDCVYFLASPLTCKKGSECEYRHSDIARVNPRDCWFWLHSNCLNPKCGFRHPPLDGLLSTQTPTPTGQPATQSQNVTTSTSHIPNASNKQTVPCVFFQKGLCLKGDWCPFLHTPNSVNNKTSVVPGTASAAEPTTFKKALGGHEKFEHAKKVPPIDTVNSVKLSEKVKPAVETEPTPHRKEFSMNRRIAHMSGVDDLPGYSVTNGNPFSWSERPHLPGELGAMNNKDVEEVSREPSPGFDVLVDDERRDSEYYPSEDHYGMPGEHEVGNEYDIDRATDFNKFADIDGERFKDPHGYDLNELRKGRHALEQRRASSERVLGGSYFDRKPYARADSINQVEDLDLRHRLNKRKKVNGLRSVISHEHARERHVEERRYPGSNRDEQYVPLHENSLSSHFRGRIRLPGGSSPPSERDAILLGPDRSRLSPARTNFSSQQGRVQDRIKGKVDEDFHNGVKNHRGPHFRRDMVADVTDFTGPKSLAELKNQKYPQPSGQHVTNQQSLGKRKHLMPDGNQQASIQQIGDDLSFDGPMPLEEILKRKRGETIETLSIKKSFNSDGVTEENNEKEGNGMAKIPLTPDFVSSTFDNKTKASIESNKDVYKPVSVDKTEDNSSSQQPVSSRIEAEGINPVDQDGESDYEEVGGESFDMYDGENGDADGEYLDDDDDDFAKKMGVMYS